MKNYVNSIRYRIVKNGKKYKPEVKGVTILWDFTI